MTRLALASALPDTPICSRCRRALGGRAIHHPLLGRISVCARCARTRGGSEEELVREMGDMLAEAALRAQLDLMDWQTVREWLLARHWTRTAIAGLADKALAHAQRQLQIRTRSRKVLGEAGQAAAALFAACVFAAFACFVPPVAHAAELTGPKPSSFWADLLPLCVFVLLITGLIAVVVSRGRKPAPKPEEPIGDTTGWRSRQ